MLTSKLKPDFWVWLPLGILYFLLQHLMGGLQTVHLLFFGFLSLLYFLSKKTRLFILLALPFALKEVIYDFLRYIPFHWLIPIHVAEPYRWELDWFGVPFQEKLITFNEFFLHWSHSLLDILCSLIYLFHAPGTILVFLILWKKGSEELVERYSTAFLLMNLCAFVTYFTYPAAAPWYVTKFGFSPPLYPMAGDPAAMVRLDALLGYPLSHHFYSFSPVVFGAIPSMHAGYTMLGFLYLFKVSPKIAFFYTLYMGWMWFAAVYLQHHYIIDLLLGALYAAAAFFLCEKVLKASIHFVFQRIRAFCIVRGTPPFLEK